MTTVCGTKISMPTLQYMQTVGIAVQSFSIKPHRLQRATTSKSALILHNLLSIHCPFQCILLYWPGFLPYSKFELLIGIHTNELLFRVLSFTKFSVYIPKWHSRRSRNAPIGCQLISPNQTGYVYIFGISAINYATICAVSQLVSL